jgi:hypothetical protein
LVIAQMDMTPLHNDCAFLANWPGVPIADQEGVIISKALGDKRCERRACRFVRDRSGPSRQCRMTLRRRRTIIC